MVGSGGVSRVSLGAVFMVTFFCFIFLGFVSHQTGSFTLVTVPSPGSFKLLESIGRQGRTGHRGLDLNYVSKRRVPNGPDPIHNRRAGKATEPPAV